MILDAFGKPTKTNRFLTPEWLTRDMVESIRERDADSRVRELRASVQPAPDGSLVGQTIRVKLPARFAKRVYTMRSESGE